MNKKTLIVGASTSVYRYSNMAAIRLLNNGYSIYLFGRRGGKVEDQEIKTVWPSDDEGIHTITVYMSAANQRQYYDQILGTGAKRIIFNPGAENPELQELAAKKGVEVLEACTLVMLSTGQY